jgi:hypothetical protein
MGARYETSVTPKSAVQTGVHREYLTIRPRTLAKLLVIAGQRCEALLATRVPNVPATDVQCDEIWGFVAKKKYHVHGGEENFAFIGDAWCFVGIEATQSWFSLILSASGRLALRPTSCADWPKQPIRHKSSN